MTTKCEKNENMTIGLLGLGAVGEAIYDVLKLYHDSVVGYDVDPKKSKNELNEVFKADVIFIALPTMLNDDGRLDVKSIENYLDKLEASGYKGLIVIKSTLPLNYLKKARKHKIRVIYSPEFLHEKTAREEMLNPDYVVCCGANKDFQEYVKVLYWVPADDFYLVDDRTAEIIKLAMNAYAATKISFVNEMERICRHHGGQEKLLMQILRLDKRCADEYAYPNRGPYGGKCLPKDTTELKNSTPGSILLEAVEQVNKRTKKYYAEKANTNNEN